ncbi:MAG: class II fructose-bisphosphate aldolase, partial [bacterium]
MLAHIKEVVKYANKHKCAIGAFNTSNLETTLGIVRAAVKMKMPVIVQISEATIKYAGLKTIANIVEVIAKDEANNVPIALHLDHGRSFQSIVACIHAGFTSVHMDASNLPFDENIALTAQAAKYAHKHGVWAQGELGAMIGKEGMTVLDVPKDPEEYMTNPRQVRQFVEKTGIDTLAVSVGTMHGLFKGLEKIDFKRLTEISKKVKTPLVLHGASGIGDTPIRRSIKLGVRIINIDTELRQAFTETLRQTIKATEGSTTFDPRKILAPSIDAVQKVVEHKI